MRYDPLSRSTVKITLSEEELREYSLCSENISLHSAETKRSLARLLKRMKLFSGYKADRLFLEAFPCPDGGCVLYVSGLAADGELPKARPAPVQLHEVMCFVGALEPLIRLCAGIGRLCGRSGSAVYAADGGYFLIFTGKKRDADTAGRLMSEYGEVIADSVSICAARERGRLICEDAAEKLGGLF